MAKSRRAHRPVNPILHLDADFNLATCLAPPRVSAQHFMVEESYIKEDFRLLYHNNFDKKNKNSKMKLFGIFATLALAQDAADNSVTISVSVK